MKYTDCIIDELKTILKDEGVLLFFLFLPVAYPLIYSWIYNNEVVRDVPVVIVDDSRSAKSREFIRRFDASPDVSVALYCNNIAEGKDAIGRAQAYGMLYIPQDFDKNLGRLEQSKVSVYCDMSYMMTYKAIYQSALNVSMAMSTDIQKKLLGKYTAREEEINTMPLEYEEVPLFNVTGGYGNFVLPGVLVLIIQQAMLLGVGMLAGTRREQRRMSGVGREAQSVVEILGRGTTYFLIFSVMLAWITLIVPRIFGFVSLVHASDLLMFFLPYMLACVFFAMCVGRMVRYRESVMLVVVFSSLPMLFMSGVTWPISNMPNFWQGVSFMFPSTFAIRGFIRMSSMGALLSDCHTEYIALWIQAIVYFTIIVAVNKRTTRV